MPLVETNNSTGTKLHQYCFFWGGPHQKKTILVEFCAPGGTKILQTEVFEDRQQLDAQNFFHALQALC